MNDNTACEDTLEAPNSLNSLSDRGKNSLYAAWAEERTTTNKTTIVLPASADVQRIELTHHHTSLKQQSLEKVCHCVLHVTS